MNELESYLKEIADKLNNVKYIEIENRKINKSDIAKIDNDTILKIPHHKGFYIHVRKDYSVENFLNIPTLMYSVNEYAIMDDLLGRHPVTFDKNDVIEYVNGLLGY